MIHRTDYLLGGGKRRKIINAAKALIERAENMSNDAKDLELGLDLDRHGLNRVNWADILRDIRGEALEILAGVNRIEGLFSEGAVLCRS